MIVMGNANVNEVSVNNVNKAEMEEQGRIAKGQMTALTHYNEEDVRESLVAPLTQYNGEDGEQWETVKTCSPSGGGNGDDVYIQPISEIPPPFNAPAEISTLTGDKYQIRVNVLIDSGQNVHADLVFITCKS